MFHQAWPTQNSSAIHHHSGGASPSWPVKAQNGELANCVARFRYTRRCNGRMVSIHLAFILYNSIVTLNSRITQGYIWRKQNLFACYYSMTGYIMTKTDTGGGGNMTLCGNLGCRGTDECVSINLYRRDRRSGSHRAYSVRSHDRARLALKASGEQAFAGIRVTGSNTPYWDCDSKCRGGGETSLMAALYGNQRVSQE